MTKAWLRALWLTVACSACSMQVWEVSARGQIDVAGAPHPAVLYWFAEQGKLYCLAQHAQSENTAELRICGAMPIELVDTGGAAGVVLAADQRGRDYLVKSVNANDELVDIEPIRQPGGARSCGRLRVRRGADLESVHLADVAEGSELVLDVLCERRPTGDRPAAQRYVLSPVQRSVEPGPPAAPLPCAASR